MACSNMKDALESKSRSTRIEGPASDINLIMAIASTIPHAELANDLHHIFDSICIFRQRSLPNLD